MVEKIPTLAVATAMAWIRAVEEGDGVGMWRLMDDNFRLCDTQLWLWANRDHPNLHGFDREELATELSLRTSDNHLWPLLIEGRVGANRHYLPDGFDETWGLLENRRIVGPDLEVLFFADTKLVGESLPPGGLLTDGFGVLMRGGPDSGYQVAAAGSDSPPQPGWPPQPGGPVDIVDR